MDYIEFGVGRGASMRWWSDHNKHPDTKFYGFDTFSGLPEDYGHYKAGTFSLEGNFPQIEDDRIEFVKGLFQDSFPGWLKDRKLDRKTVWHLDPDLYSATIFVMSQAYPFFKKGDIILFDEFGVPLHEYRAFEDFVSSFYVTLEPIGAVNNYLQVGFKITDLDKRPSF